MNTVFKNATIMKILIKHGASVNEKYDFDAFRKRFKIEQRDNGFGPKYHDRNITKKYHGIKYHFFYVIF